MYQVPKLNSLNNHRIKTLPFGSCLKAMLYLLLLTLYSPSGSSQNRTTLGRIEHAFANVRGSCLCIACTRSREARMVRCKRARRFASGSENINEFLGRILLEGTLSHYKPPTLSPHAAHLAIWSAQKVLPRPEPQWCHFSWGMVSVA